MIKTEKLGERASKLRSHRCKAKKSIKLFVDAKKTQKYQDSEWNHALSFLDLHKQAQGYSLSDATAGPYMGNFFSCQIPF